MLQSKTDRAEPRRKKERRDKDEPNCALSSTDKVKTLPSRPMPSNDSVEPILAHDLMDTVLPNSAKAMRDTEDPNRE